VPHICLSAEQPAETEQLGATSVATRPGSNLLVLEQRPMALGMVAPWGLIRRTAFRRELLRR